jgi:hypothetical protein
VFLIASALAYYLVAGFYVIFASLCAVFELGVKRNLLLAAFCVLCAVVIPVAGGAWLFDLSVNEAYRGIMLPHEEHWLATPSSVLIGMTIRACLLLFFPVAAIALVCGAALARFCRGIRSLALPSRAESSAKNSARESQATKDAISGSSPDGAHVSDRPVSGVRPAIQWAALVVVAVGAAVVSFDFPKSCLLEMAYADEEQRWADVLSHARRLPPSDTRALDPRTLAHVNRALYYSNCLLDRMFTYPQSLDTPSLALVYESATTMARLTPRQCSDILFDLGRVNEAEHMAYEALEIFGERPRILKRLIYINVIKAQPEAARRFLALLERSLLHGSWARRLSRQLDADPILSGVPEVASRRELMVIYDSVDETACLETMLQGLLERNRRNRMALEYLMAHYLLTRQLDKLVANLYRFDDFDYPRLPRHCQEALILHLATTGSQDVDFWRPKISPQTRRRFGEFVRIERQFRQDVSAAFAALHPDFGDSYFFCYVFGHNNPSLGQSRPSE